jgi:hypothetical protein
MDILLRKDESPDEMSGLSLFKGIRYRVKFKLKAVQSRGIRT